MPEDNSGKKDSQAEPGELGSFASYENSSLLSVYCYWFCERFLSMEENLCESDK